MTEKIPNVLIRVFIAVTSGFVATTGLIMSTNSTVLGPEQIYGISFAVFLFSLINSAVLLVSLMRDFVEG